MALPEKTKQQVFDLLKAKTHLFASKNGFIKEKEESTPKIDPRLQRLANLAHQLGGCSSDEFKELISLLVGFTGHELPEPEVSKSSESGLTAIKFAVITLLANNNNHNYPFGKNAQPILLHKPDMDGSRAHGMKANTWEGNWLPMEFEKDVKPATEKEIKEFVEEFSKNSNALDWATKILATK